MAPPLEVDLGILGWSDSLILMVLALVVFGPRRLPQIGRQIGKLMYEFRKASNDFKFQMEEELRAAEEADRRKKEEERLRALAAQSPPAPPEPTPPVSSGSPYSEDAVYPPSAPAATALEPAPAETAPAETTPAETAPAETAPRILPPSTGEQVAADRPGAAAAAAETRADASSQNGHITLNESAAVDSVPAPETADPPVEQTAQHG